MESGARISYTKTLEEQTSVYLSVSPPNLSMMLVWNNLADPHLSVFFDFARFSQTLSLKNISKTRRYLSQDATEILIHAYITSKLDNCNSPLYGLPTYMINKLETIQNAAARIVTSERKLLISLLFYASFTGCQFNIELFLKCSC